MYNVGYSASKDSVHVLIEKLPMWVWCIENATDKLCILTGHRWCNILCSVIYDRIVSKYSERHLVPSTRPDIEVLSLWLRNEYPYWVDDDEDNDS